jgi:predicted ATPase
MVTGEDEPNTSHVAWPAFPWNPRNLKDPLIGRDYAIAELEAGWSDVLKNWRGRIHLLLAEYGMGKSRLASIFVNRALETENEAWIIRCQCPRYGSTYRLWDVILRTAFGIPGSADEVQAGEHLLEAVRSYLPQQADELASLVAYLTRWEVPGRADLHLHADHDALVSRATGALAQLFAAMCMERPVLMIVDNADRATESLVVAGALEATLKDRPFMLVLTGSSDFIDVLPGWNRFPSTQLGPLVPEDSRALLNLFLSGLGEPPIEFMDKVVESTSGSPSAIKAIVRYVRENGAIRAGKSGFTFDKNILAELEMPDDVESMVLARAGKLPAHERDLLALAGVVGKAFWLGAIIAMQRQDESALLEPGSLLRDDRPQKLTRMLNKLVELRFVEIRPSNIVGEESYAFRSDLHWEVAYNLLPAVKRQRYHQVVEQWLLLNVASEPDPYLEELAYHAENGGYTNRAAGYLQRAAKVAGARHGLVDERRLLLSARALVSEEDTQTYFTIHFELGAAMQRVGDLDLALECYQSALQMAWRMRNRRLGASALARIGGVESDRGDYESAYNHLHRALQLFEIVGDQPGIAEACSHLGRMYRLRGEFDNALKAYEQAESSYSSQRHEAGVAATVHAVAAVYAERGDLALAEERYQRALTIRREANDLNGIAATLNDLGCIWMMQDRTEESVPLWEEGSEIAQNIGERATEATIRDSLGEGLIELGRYDEARGQLEAAIQVATAVGNIRVITHSHLHLSRVCLLMADLTRSEEALEAACTHAEQLQLPLLSGLVERAQGELALARLDIPAESATKKSESKKKGKGKKAGASGSKAKKKGPTKAQIKESMKVIEGLFRKAIETFELNGYDGEAASTHDKLADAFELASMKAKANKERKASATLRELHVVQ